MTKFLILTTLLLITIPSFAESIQQQKELITELGVVYVGMPREDLLKVYSEMTLKGSYEEGNEEWLTFSDWMTEEGGDLITFYLVDGKVRGWKEK